MTMTRVRIKHAQGKDLVTRRRLLKILAPEIKVTRLIPVRDAVIVLTATVRDADLIFKKNKLEQLIADGFTALMPPTLRAQRSVVCKRLDDLVYEHAADVIINEVEKEQSWAKVQEVYKFPNSNTIKITFLDSDMAKKATEVGLLMFRMSIPPFQIHQEEYFELLTCYRGYAVEDHVTKLCPKPSTYQVCSNCAEEGHQHWECKTKDRKCLNCQEGHHATAMRCHIRKQALKVMQENQKIQKNKGSATSYAQAAHSSAVQDAMGAQKTGLMCLFHAHMAKFAEPGSFQKSLSENLAKNGLPEVKLTPIPNAHAIFTALAAGADLPTPQRQKDDTPSQEEAVQAEAEGAQALVEESNEESSDSDASEDIHENNKKTAKKLEVIIVKKDSDKWPRTRTFPYLEKGVREEWYNIRHNLKNKDNEKVIERLRQEENPLDDLLTTVGDEVFTDMETGPFSDAEPETTTKERKKKRNRSRKKV